MKFNNIRHKWRSGAQNNRAVDQQPNPCQMEPPPWPAVSTTQPRAPPQLRDKQIKLRQLKTWAPVTLKNIQWKLIKIDKVK